MKNDARMRGLPRERGQPDAPGAKEKAPGSPIVFHDEIHAALRLPGQELIDCRRPFLLNRMKSRAEQAIMRRRIEKTAIAEKIMGRDIGKNDVVAGIDQHDRSQNPIPLVFNALQRNCPVSFVPMHQPVGLGKCWADFVQKSAEGLKIMIAGEASELAQKGFHTVVMG